MKHVINIDNYCSLETKNRQLIINKGLDSIQLPFEDIIAISIDANGVSIKKEIINLCSEYGVIIYWTDNKHIPQSILLPMHGHVQQTKILETQIKMSEIKKDDLWAMVISSKIFNQYSLCSLKNIPAERLKLMSDEVISGDSTGIEAQAARIYFKLIFGHDFIRDRDMKGTNLFLNYSYALIRASIARSICLTGLHPSFGIHHHNQFDPMPLASDLMEPFRPFCDNMVYRLLKDVNYKDEEITVDIKKNLIKIFTEPCIIDGKATTIDYAIRIYISSVKGNIENNSTIIFPKLCL